MRASPPSDFLAATFARIATDAALWRDFERITSYGGRLAGSAGDRAAADYSADVLRDLGATVQFLDVPFDGWRSTRALLDIAGISWPCRALLRSAATPSQGLRAKVVDLGRGVEADFQREQSRLRGAIALVSHEYPFSATHLHRRRKLALAQQHGAAAFLIANPIPGGGLLSGSSGRERNAEGIPAAYISAETAAAVRDAATQSLPITMHIGGEDFDAIARNVIADFPGTSDRLVALSAHLDGHDLAQSALDNASGVACALAVARALAQHRSPVGLRVALFSAEEWALTGSAKILAGWSADERSRIVANINLDTVGGDDHLTALVSEFESMRAVAEQASQWTGIPIATHWPVMANSDHANFARVGIPALRLVAGFNRPDSNVRHILSAQDTIDKVTAEELEHAARAAAALVLAALTNTPARGAR